MSPESLILDAATTLIHEHVGGILLEMEAEDGEHVPSPEIIENGTYGSIRLPAATVAVTGAELTEKDRIVKNERYLLTISITTAGKRPVYSCYRYALAIGRALREDPTLGGAADAARLLKKDYRFPPIEEGNENHQVIVTIAVIRETV